MTTRDVGNVESLGLLSGHGEKFTGCIKESPELNTSALLRETKAQLVHSIPLILVEMVLARMENLMFRHVLISSKNVLHFITIGCGLCF